eukprot:372296-Amphidinium_carterae.1
MEADKRATERVNTLRSTITPLLLESTPDVLSIGRRCVTEGYSFHWEKGENPYFVDKKGRRIDLSVERYIPYLNDISANTVPIRTHSGYTGEPEDNLVSFDTDFDEVMKITPDVQLSDHDHGEVAPEGDIVEADIAQTGRSRRSFVLTHLPKNPYCHNCARGKATNVRSPRTSGSEVYKQAKKFGDVVTVDHAIAQGKMDYGIDKEAAMVVVLDVHTRWLQFPVLTKDADEICNALRVPS